MSKFEKKFGKYAIPNLTLFLITCYAVGYICSLIKPELLGYLTLDPAAILRGQIWRIVTWIMIPVNDTIFFVLIMLYFYYFIGTTMERTMGTYKYNVFLFRGIFLTLLAALLCYGYLFITLIMKGDTPEFAFACLESVFQDGAYAYSCFYLNISIFLAFAICYPNMEVLLMFVLPVKVKWMGVLDLVVLAYYLYAGDLLTRSAVLAVLLNVLLFYLSYKDLRHLKPSQVKRRMDYQKNNTKPLKIARHKCAICGQTSDSNPELEFRFCSKCNGNYEYCMEHLYTHEHVK